ncbi:MAG TPA: zinc-dependent alcohol dehydrogenase family protein [Acidimicrobiia bacterium]|nr:zinc-dependent alcohol dehydrogenase family protein [Acidimicrobiia bacterium]
MRRQLLEHPGSLTGRPLRVSDIDDLVPGSGEIVIGVAACGVCRTDLQIVEGDLEARILPVVPGHQIVGRIRRVGNGVTGWSVGDRVGAGWLGGACGSCEYCVSGRENLCADAVFNGWDRDGGYAEQAVVRGDYALRIPPSFSDVEAAPLLCGGIIGYRSLKISGLQPGGRLGLYGFGASALLAMQVAVHWGCDVFVATRSPVEQERAIEMGAAWTGSYHDRPPVALDAAITFAPAGYVVVEALKSVARGGIVAINAIHLDRVPEFGYDLLWGERQIRSVANFTREDAREFLTLAAEIPIRTVPDVYPLADANLALQRLKDGLVQGAAVLAVDR